MILMGLIVLKVLLMSEILLPIPAAPGGTARTKTSKNGQ